MRVPLWVQLIMATGLPAMMMHRQSDRQAVRMESSHSLMLLPCRVVRQARRVTIRLLGYQPTLDRLQTWRTIEGTVF